MEEIKSRDWPEAEWGLSALFAHDYFVWMFVDILKNEYGVTDLVKRVFGCPAFKWNGEDIVYGRPTAEGIVKTLEGYNDRGIEVYATFTRPQARPLDDNSCNFLLDRIAEMDTDSGVVVTDYDLLMYVRDKYPDMKVMASVSTMEYSIMDRIGLYMAHANELNFDTISVHPDDASDYNLLLGLPVDKMQVTVNENCIKNCENRVKHYGLISNATRDPYDIIARKRLDDMVCPKARSSSSYYDRVDMLEVYNNDCSLNRSMLKKVYDMGYRKFKIQGRSNTLEEFAFDVTRYLLEGGTSKVLFQTIMGRMKRS